MAQFRTNIVAHFGIDIYNKITNNLLNIKKEHKLIYEKRDKKDTTLSNKTILDEMRNIKYD